jgi:hypothetical protein
MNSEQLISIICYYVRQISLLKGYLKDLKIKKNKLEKSYELFFYKYNYVNVKHNNTINFLLKNNANIILAMKSIEKMYSLNKIQIKSTKHEINEIELKLDKYNKTII